MPEHLSILMGTVRHKGGEMEGAGEIRDICREEVTEVRGGGN